MSKLRKILAQITFRFSLKLALVSATSFLMVGALVYAAPFAPPSSTGYSLDDLYNRIVHGTKVTPGTGSFAPPGGAPAPTMRTLTEIYEAIPAPPKYFGQVGLPDNYTNNGDGTVTDNNTGLMWKRCVEGLSGATCTGSNSTMDWQTAVSHCASLSFAGYSDWYLPNISELVTLVDYGVSSGARINQSFFPNTPSSGTWSSSTSASNTSTAWYVPFGSGGTSSYYNTHSHAVRCVRQQLPEDAETYGLTLTMEGNFPGLDIVTIESTPTGISCTGNATSFAKVCGARFEKDSSVMLEASTAGGWQEWTGCDSSGGGYCQVNLDETKSVEVFFPCPIDGGPCPVS